MAGERQIVIDEGAARVWKAEVDDLIDILDRTLQEIENKILEKLVAIADSITEKLTSMAEDLTKAFTNLINTIRDAIQTFVDIIKDVANNGLEIQLNFDGKIQQIKNK